MAKRERKFGLLGRRRRRRAGGSSGPPAPMLHVEFMNSLLKRKRKFPNKPKRAAAAAQTMKMTMKTEIDCPIHRKKR